MTLPKEVKPAVSLAELWSIQESLLQSYRSIFITIESVIFALSAFVTTTQSDFVFAKFPLMFLGVFLIPIWMCVCHARARAVTFVHWMIQRQEAGESVQLPYSCFRQFQMDRKFNGLTVTEDKQFKKLSDSKTRKRMDLVVPVIFGLCWLVLLVMQVWSWLSGKPA
jgi:hypothetical protein